MTVYVPDHSTPARTQPLENPAAPAVQQGLPFVVFIIEVDGTTEAYSLCAANADAAKIIAFTCYLDASKIYLEKPLELLARFEKFGGIIKVEVPAFDCEPALLASIYPYVRHEVEVK